MLVGRERDLERVRAALEAGPVVTVWGPAGAGKSALARAALGPRPVVSDLGACRDAAALGEALSASLGVAPRPELPLSRQLARALACAEAPVLLDNADGVRAPLAELLASVGPTETGRPIVITLRSRLGLDDERAVEIGPLGSAHALALWAEACARHGVVSDPAVASALVERLDRLPAALTWMASRAAMIGERECLARAEAGRFADDPVRRSLGESLISLPDRELSALRLIACFEAGCPVTLLERERGDALDVVDALARRSLVSLAPTDGADARVRAYEAVRARALEGLPEPDRRALHRAHARMILGQVADGGRDPGRLRVELEAVRRRFDPGDPALALRAALPLRGWDVARGGAASARARLEALWPRLAEGDPLRARARLAAAGLARLVGDGAAARAHADAVLTEHGEHVVEALLERAQLDRRESRLEAALAGCVEATELARALGDPAREAAAIGEHGRMLQSLGRVAEALELHAQAIALCRASGALDREALERSLHARATHRAGHLEEAIDLHERALAMHEASGDRRLAAAERGHLGFCLHELGALEAAEEAFRASARGLAQVGDVTLEHIERVLLARVLVDRERLAAARLELTLARALVAGANLPRLALTADFVSGLARWRGGDRPGALAVWREGYARGPLFEVGFEALLGAYLALAEARVGEPARARTLIEETAPMVDRLESPGPRAAFSILRAHALGEPPPRVAEELSARSSDVRRARWICGPDRRPLVVAADGRRARTPDGVAIDLRRRAAPRRILSALAAARRDRPGEALGRDALIAAGWPDERMLAAAADKRLRTAVWTLRKAGLGELLMTTDDGYLLDPDVLIAEP